VGTGYSEIFTGTAGSIGKNQFHQLSFTDEMPVRRKQTEIGSGASGGVVDEIVPIITAKMILAMCERCRSGNITPGDLVAWLNQISSTSEKIEKAVRAVLRKHIRLIEASINEKSFWKRLSDFEKDIQSTVM
jgi:hypothetical protein